MATLRCSVVPSMFFSSTCWACSASGPVTPTCLASGQKIGPKGFNGFSADLWEKNANNCRKIACKNIGQMVHIIL